MKRIMIAVGVALALAHAGARAIPAPPQDIDQLFAPIALYPDALLGPMLLSAQDPSKIGALSEWLRSNDTLKGTALQDAAKASGFSESYVAIVLFPQVVNTMAEQMEWTTKIGKAFTADRSAVFASIQRLRVKAKDAGKLKTNAQQEVTTETSWRAVDWCHHRPHTRRVHQGADVERRRDEMSDDRPGGTTIGRERMAL